MKARDRDGNTPLLKAASAGDLKEMERCLAAGSDVNAKNRQGSAAIHIAVESGRTDMALLLMSKGASLTIRDRKFRTPLMIARNKNNREMIDILTGQEKSGPKPKRK